MVFFLFFPGVFLSSIATAEDSVYRVSLARDLTITAAAATAGLIPYLLSSDLITRRCPCDPHEVNTFDRNAIGNRSGTALVVSDLVAGAAVLGPVAVDALLLGRSDALFEDIIVYAQTLAAATAIVTLTKTIVQRPVPRSYDGDPEYINSDQGYRSFYSGHTTVTVAALSAAAVTANLRHDLGIWPWLVVGGVGGGVAISRILGGVHFPTDTMAGAAAGLAIGTIIPLLHARPRESVSAMLLPQPGGAKLVFHYFL